MIDPTCSRKRMNIARRALVLLVGVVLAASALQAGPDIEIPDNVRQFTVDGITVLTRPSGPANHVVYAKIYIRGGITALRDNQSPAIEDLTLDVPIASGPLGTDRAAHQREMERTAIGISASTERDYSVLNLRCVNEMFPRAWEIFTGIVLRPQYDQLEFRNAKDQMLSLIRNRSINPESYATYLADSVFFAGHPYGRFAQESDLANITVDLLQAHQRELFVKSRIFLVVVGNVDSMQLRSMISSTLGKLPTGSYRQAIIPAPRNARIQQFLVRKPYGNQRAVTNYIVARYLAPGVNDSLYYPFMRLTSFLSGSLFREVRVQRNLSYAPEADARFSDVSYGEITISTTLPDSAWRVAKGEVVDFFRNYIIGEESIKSGLAGWITSYYMREQTNESQASKLGEAYLYTGDWRRAFGLVDGISSVTPTQMNRAALRYLRNMTIVIVGDPSSVTPSQYVADIRDDESAKNEWEK